MSDVVERRLVLLRQQLAEDEERIRQLPASKEGDFRARLGELREQIDDIRARLYAYRDAPPEKAKEALAALERSLAELAERRRAFEAQLKTS